jgi:hypothetical protein
MYLANDLFECVRVLVFDHDRAVQQRIGSSSSSSVAGWYDEYVHGTGPMVDVRLDGHCQDIVTGPICAIDLGVRTLTCLTSDRPAQGCRVSILKSRVLLTHQSRRLDQLTSAGMSTQLLPSFGARFCPRNAQMPHRTQLNTRNMIGSQADDQGLRNNLPAEVP